MLNKYSRSKFIPIVDAGDHLERDLVMGNWDLFKIKRPIGFDSIKMTDIYRPDLLAIRIYGNISFWWYLLKVNSIDDYWNDIEIGQDIIVPDPQDIRDFTLKVRAKQRKE